MRLLLHICCAPCAIYPLRRLREKGYEVGGFFYNPNIHPLSEYRNRQRAVEELSTTAKFKIAFLEYEPEVFFRRIVNNEDKSKRCMLCWQMRLEKAAKFAKQNRFNLFSTTLLISPYQNQTDIRSIGEEIGREKEVKFYFEDFSTGFEESQKNARNMGLYRQKYCGCLYSELERYNLANFKNSKLISPNLPPTTFV